MRLVVSQLSTVGSDQSEAVDLGVGNISRQFFRKNYLFRQLKGSQPFTTMLYDLFLCNIATLLEAGNCRHGLPPSFIAQSNDRHLGDSGALHNDCLHLFRTDPETAGCE